MKLDGSSNEPGGSGWSWVEVGGARCGWVEMGARFSNTHILYTSNSYNHKKKID